MESLDGATTIRVLKAMNPQVSIVAMSGLQSYDIGFDMTGIEGFLFKRFTSQDILQAFQAIDTQKSGWF